MYIAGEILSQISEVKESVVLPVVSIAATEPSAKAAVVFH
jgi:hypothetical protein